jgi:hypothetical protein
MIWVGGQMTAFFLWRAIPGRHPAGASRDATLKIVPDDFLWCALSNHHPAGRRDATLKIAPGNFLSEKSVRNHGRRALRPWSNGSKVGSWIQNAP